MGKEKLSISSFALTFRKNIEIVAMISADAYRLSSQLKEAQVFAHFMRDLKFEDEKDERLETHPKNVVLEDYQELLDVFSKKDQNILSIYQKYYHKIMLEDENEHSPAP